MAFNPKEHLTNLKGKDYLEVKWRLVWFREEHPKGAISTELVSMQANIVMRATVYAADGQVLASAHGSAPLKGNGSWAGREIEKAETAAIGRALGHAGYGTQFEPDNSDADYLADTPVEPAKKATTPPIKPVQAQSTTQGVTSAADAEFNALPRAAWAGWTKQLATQLCDWALNEYAMADAAVPVALGVTRISEYKGNFSEAQAAITAHAKAVAF